MTRKSRTKNLNTSGVAGLAPTFNPDESAWKDIGGSYVTLNDGDRSEIVRIANEYLSWREFEDGAISHADVAAVFAKLEAAMSRCLRTLQETHDVAGGALDNLSQTDAETDAIVRLGRQLAVVPDRSPGDAEARVTGFVSSFIGMLHEPIGRVELILKAIKNAHSELQEQQGPGIHRHDVWKAFAADLIRWARGRGLSVTTAKQTGASRNWPSPFVKFFDRLQGHFPERAQAYNFSPGSLTDALDDVRKRIANPAS